jgi:predicted O-methyltransferase YrrM
MNSKLKTIIWFLKKPQYIPQIFQVIKRNKNKASEDTRAEATKWCEDNSISQLDAIKKITSLSQLEKIDTLFPNEILNAKKIVEECPVNMGGEGAISFLYHLIKEKKSEKIIETGVAYGWSSLAILLAIKENDNAKLISNDMPYIKMNNDDYVGCIIPDELKSKWELQRQPDIKGIPIALKKMNNEIDVCHYDSDKSYTGRMWSSPLLWNALKKNGIFISDDINDNIAFKHFSESVNRTPIIIEHLGKYVGIIIK